MYSQGVYASKSLKMLDSVTLRIEPCQESQRPIFYEKLSLCDAHVIMRWVDSFLVDKYMKLLIISKLQQVITPVATSCGAVEHEHVGELKAVVTSVDEFVLEKSLVEACIFVKTCRP